MSIVTLPEALNLKNKGPIQVYNYRILNSASRYQINLSKNTFSFLVEGTKEVITNNQFKIVENHHFLLLKSGNCLMTETVSNANKVYKSILLFFTDEMLFNFLEQKKIQPILQENNDTFYVCKYDAYIKHFVESLEKVSLLSNQLQTQLLKTKFEEIMIYLIQKEGASFLNCIFNKPSDQIIQFKKVIEFNKLNKLSLQELSFICNMSLSTFKRTFVKEYQMTPIKWFQEKRLEHAAFLLLTQHKRPIELYEEAGYESLSNFIQAFKKQYGKTPKQYQIQQ